LQDFADDDWIHSSDVGESIMAADHDEHDGPIHQSTWVPGLTVGVCLAFVAIMVAVRIFAGADLGAPL
jgi:hypothetical protein